MALNITAAKGPPTLKSNVTLRKLLVRNPGTSFKALKYVWVFY